MTQESENTHGSCNEETLNRDGQAVPLPGLSVNVAPSTNSPERAV